MVGGVVALTAQPSSATMMAASDAPAVPTLRSAIKTPRYVSVVWHHDPAAEGFNVYRNDQYLKSVRGTVFNDFHGKLGDRYVVEAYKANGQISKRSRPMIASGIPTIGQLTVASREAEVALSWPKDGRTTWYRVYRDGRFLASVWGNSLIDTTAGPSHTYSVVKSGPAASAPRSSVRYRHRPPSRSSISARNLLAPAPRTGTQTTSNVTVHTTSGSFPGTITVGADADGFIYERVDGNRGLYTSVTTTFRDNTTTQTTTINGVVVDHYTRNPDGSYQPDAIVDGLHINPSPPPSGSDDGYPDGSSSRPQPRQPNGAAGVTFDKYGYPDGGP